MSNETKHYPEEDANGWIDRKVRPPTKDDTNELGDIRWYSRVGNGAMAHGGIDVDACWTHWKPAGPGPVVETEEERQAREDSEAFDDACKLWEFNPSVRLLGLYEHALAHARRERK